MVVADKATVADFCDFGGSESSYSGSSDLSPPAPT